MRVLHVIGGLELGGAETLLYRLATHPTSEFEQQVICLGPRNWYSAPLEESGIKVDHLEMTSTVSSLRGLQRLRRIIRERRPDVIQSWMYFANVLSSVSARRTPVVWSLHASTFEHLGLPSRVCAYAGGLFAGRLSSFVINCSQQSAVRHARFGYGGAPNRLIHNGYDPEAFFPDEEACRTTRASLGLDPATFLIGSISRWHSEKDVPTLLEALARVTADKADVRCLLIGPGLELSNAAFAKELERFGVKDKVIALGRRNDVADLARALDLNVLSSRSEAFPNVVAETMLSGTPNVVTDAGDSALMVGETGWVVPPRDPSALAQAIARAAGEWSADKPAWQRRREAARRRIAEQYSFDRMVTAYHQVWKEAVGSPLYAQDRS